MKTSASILAGLGAFAGLLLLGAATNWFGLVAGRPMAKYAEETRRQVYEESRAYQQGMAVDLDELCRQRKLTDDEGEKAVLAETIRLRSARFTGELPQHIEECLHDVR